MVTIARKAGRAAYAALRAAGRFVREAWPIFVELSALATVCAGIGLVCVPAALVVGGAAVIFAVERTASSAGRTEP